MNYDQKIDHMLLNAQAASNWPEIAGTMSYKCGYLRSYLTGLAMRFPEVAKDIEDTLAWQERVLSK
jgi:hypothetical protein